MTINRGSLTRMSIEYDQLTELDHNDPPAYICFHTGSTQVQVIWDENAATELFVVEKDDLVNQLEKLINQGKLIYKTEFIPLTKICMITTNRNYATVPPENRALRDKYTDKYTAYSIFDSGFIVTESELVDRVKHCLTDIEWSFKGVRWVGRKEEDLTNLYCVSAYWIGTFVSFEDLEKDENSQYFVNGFTYIYIRDDGLFFADERTSTVNRGTESFHLVKDDAVVGFIREAMLGSPNHDVHYIDPIKDHAYCVIRLAV